MNPNNKMIPDEHKALEQLQPLIKIIKDREVLYFETLSFTNKNIQSSSNQIDQIAIFKKFLIQVTAADQKIVAKETFLLNQIGPSEQTHAQGFKVSNSSKQMMRLSARVLEMLQASIEKTKNTLFNQNGKIGIDFSRFKKAMHKTIKQQLIDLTDFCTIIIHFAKNKYRRQVAKIKNYLTKLQAGEHISLKDLFLKQGSDTSASPSPQQKNFRFTKSIKPNKRLNKQLSPQSESPSRKISTKKVILGNSKTKRNINLRNSKKQESQEDILGESKTKLSKSATVSFLLKFYAIMEINKKQFLQDYLFQKQYQQKQKKKLLTQLLQKNTKNAEIINQFYSKCQNFKPSLHNLSAYSSDQNHQTVQRNDSSTNSKVSLRTSFIISKRKGSFAIQSGSDRSDVQHITINNKLSLSKTIKNFGSSKRSLQKKPNQVRPKHSNQSKKIFVIKSPMKFDDEIIPKADTSNTCWIQAPLTGRGERSRKNQYLRLKKKNNPVPLDQKYLAQSFRISQYPS